MTVPRLETKRLLLREWRQDDFETYARWMSDPDVVRWLTGEPMARGDAWRSLAVMAGHWILRGYGFWAVEEKTSGTLVGRVGLWNPETWPGLEVGWTLGREHWGKGYATEAALASMDYAFMTQPISKLLSVIHVSNTPSQKVAARLGETRGEKSTEIVFGGKTFPVDLWGITRDAWAARKPQ